jgi:GAF domain-containing protein
VDQRDAPSPSEVFETVTREIGLLFGADLARMERYEPDGTDDLQEISRGIHPAILSRGGLGPALKTLARRSPVPVDLELRSHRRLPQPVEVAAYGPGYTARLPRIPAAAPSRRAPGAPHGVRLV